MNAFIFIGAVLVVAVVGLCVRYSRQRRHGSYDLESTRKATTRSMGSGLDSGGIGGGGY
jgi:hypothetical protein